MAETGPGGMVKSKSGGWVPPNHPDAVAESYQAGDWTPPDAPAPAPSAPAPSAPAPSAPQTPLPPSPAPAPAPSAPAVTSPQPPGFVASKAGGWVPPDHPDAVTASPAVPPTAPAPTLPQPPPPVTGPPADGQMPPATGTTLTPPSVNPMDYNIGAEQQQQKDDYALRQAQLAQLAGRQPMPFDEGRQTSMDRDSTGRRLQGEDVARSPEQIAAMRAMGAQLTADVQSGRLTPEQADARWQQALRGESGGAPQDSALRDQMQQALLAQLGQTAVPGVDDPVIRQQMGGIEATAERQRRLRQSAAAERLAGQGLSSSGAADAELASGAQDAAQMVTDSQRQLLLAETQDRRNRIQQTLATGSQFLSAEKQAELQKELGYLNAAVQREGFGTQKDISGMEIGSRERITGAQLATDQWKTNVGADLQRAGYKSAEAIASLNRESQERIAQLDAQMRQAGYSSQERIAALDQSIRQAQIASQTGLGMADINLRGQLGRGQLNLGLLGLLSGDAQARDRLNFDVGKYQQDQNYLATLALLGGGS